MPAAPALSGNGAASDLKGRMPAAERQGVFRNRNGECGVREWRRRLACWVHSTVQASRRAQCGAGQSRLEPLWPPTPLRSAANLDHFRPQSRRLSRISFWKVTVDHGDGGECRRKKISTSVCASADTPLPQTFREHLRERAIHELD